jgi:hypothetical protein
MTTTRRPIALSRFAALEKLKRAAAKAVDPWAALPLIQAQAYTTSAALIIGEVVKANGNLYVVIVNGTTASSGTGPSATSGQATDGTVAFAYLSPAPADYTDPDAPVVTLTTSTPVGTLPNVVSPEAPNAAAYLANAMRPLGGYITIDGSNRNQLITFDRHTGGAVDAVGKYTGWDFETDAPSLAIRFSTIAIVRTIGVEIDGRLVRLGGYALPAGGQAWLKLDIPGLRKKRHIRVWHGQGGDVRLRDVYVAARDYVQAPTRERVRAAFISDSLMDGAAYGPMVAGGSMQQRVSAALGWDDPWSFVQGSTGYLNPGTGPYLTFEQRVAEAATRNPDVWVLFGSTNDGAYTSPQRVAAALACLKAIRSVSTAPIFMLGVWSVNSGTPAIEADMKAAFDGFADPLSIFIPVSSPVGSLPWIVGAHNNAGHPAASNLAYSIGSDAIHPYDAGTVLAAARATNEIRSAIMAM